MTTCVPYCVFDVLWLIYSAPLSGYEEMISLVKAAEQRTYIYSTLKTTDCDNKSRRLQIVFMSICVIHERKTAKSYGLII